MNREYNLTGTKIIMRRLFLYDSDAIIDCYKDFDNLFFNPVNHKFTEDIFLYGEFWGAFLSDKLIACCYYHPLDCDFFRQTHTFSLISDFITCPENYLNMGYIGINAEGKDFFEKFATKKPAHSLFEAFLNIAEMQAFRRGLRHILNYIPLKLTDDIHSRFRCGCHLVKLRGLDKLIVHYFFDKPVYAQEYRNNENFAVKCVALSDTKQLSRLLEAGWYGYDIFEDNNTSIIKMQKLISD